MKDSISSFRLKLVHKLHTHQSFVIIITVLLLLGFVIIRVNMYNNLEYDEAYYNQQTSDLKSVQFNQQAIKQIEELRDSNVNEPSVQLPRDRTNPFAE